MIYRQGVYAVYVPILILSWHSLVRNAPCTASAADSAEEHWKGTIKAFDQMGVIQFHRTFHNQQLFSFQKLHRFCIYFESAIT